MIELDRFRTRFVFSPLAHVGQHYAQWCLGWRGQSRLWYRIRIPPQNPHRRDSGTTRTGQATATTAAARIGICNGASSAACGSDPGHEPHHDGGYSKLHGAYGTQHDDQSRRWHDASATHG